MVSETPVTERLSMLFHNLEHVTGPTDRSQSGRPSGSAAGGRSEVPQREAQEGDESSQEGNRM